MRRPEYDIGRDRVDWVKEREVLNYSQDSGLGDWVQGRAGAPN